MARKKASPTDAAPGEEPSAAPEADLDAEMEEVEAFMDEQLDRLRLGASEAYDRLSETAAQLAEQARHVYGESQDYVRHHPAVPLLGALAIGVVIGILLGRR